MQLRSLTFAFAVVSLFAGGCGFDDGPFGPARPSTTLAPFAGKWVFDLEKTLKAMKASGVTEEEIAQTRKFFADPKIGSMHDDIAIQGNVIVGSGQRGLPDPEYRLFGMHKHDKKVCGKAWHHEDRHDPGDMSKCHVRLSTVDGSLHLEVNMQEDPPALNDPDIAAEPPVEGDMAKCKVGAKDGPKTEDWHVFVFSRGK